MQLSTKSMGWHVGSLLTGAIAGVSYAASGQIDLYSLYNEFQAWWAQTLKIVGLLSPIAAVIGAAYRTYGSKQVPTTATAVQLPAASSPSIGDHVAVSPADSVSPAVVAKVVGMLLFCLIVWPQDSFAQTRLQNAAQRNDVNAPRVVSPLAPASGSIKELLDQFDQVRIDDLTTAIAYAQSEEDRAAVACYTVWLEQVQRLAKVRADNPDKDGPQVITTFQKARNLVKRLDTDSPLRMACAALAADAKQDVKQFIGAIISGAALKMFVP